MMMLDAIDTKQYPLSGETSFPMMYSSANFTTPDLLAAESDLTYSLPVSRKRSRLSYSMSPLSDAQNVNRNLMDHCPSFTFLGEDISSQIRQQEIEIDQLVARHAEKLKLEIEAKRRRYSRKLISAVDERITHMLRAKDDEIMKMVRLNCALEERVKSLCIENQIWRELAETNEATANALRSNLKQVLEQLVNNDIQHSTTNDNAVVALADDAESCCESNNEHSLAEQDNSNNNSNSNVNRLCKSCWKAESCVLLLPCRHLCLCTVCASSVHICPICKSSKNISVHVHMS
ncbi:putative BOI-related E3 ubiquitin-protein ligase 3 [Bidens hawaiensis]|uniref:putative BOI-related E3 ubiquitin-protein ligase 3 n=1 Tax=Bidens hawaiensis TaxID=980011 RepID=UPI00404A3D92